MRYSRSIALAFLVLLVTAGVALALPVKLTSTPLARGTWDRAERSKFLNALENQARMVSSDVFIVKATLDPGDSVDPTPGMTDWHRHTGPSVVVVTAGELTISMAAANNECMTHIVRSGRAFSHSTRPHNFINNADVTAEFYVVYFVPAGSPLIPAEAPGSC